MDKKCGHCHSVLPELQSLKLLYDKKIISKDICNLIVPHVIKANTYCKMLDGLPCGNVHWYDSVRCAKCKDID